jgi:hypothetical protein
MVNFFTDHEPDSDRDQVPVPLSRTGGRTDAEPAASISSTCEIAF